MASALKNPAQLSFTTIALHLSDAYVLVEEIGTGVPPSPISNAVHDPSHVIGFEWSAQNDASVQMGAVVKNMRTEPL
jgi:hypothetical protein